MDVGSDLIEIMARDVKFKTWPPKVISALREDGVPHSFLGNVRYKDYDTQCFRAFKGEVLVASLDFEKLENEKNLAFELVCYMQPEDPI